METNFADTNRYAGAIALLGMLMLSLGVGSGLSDQVGAKADSTDEKMSREERPNILLLVADDLGYDDSTLYNAASPARTPSLLALAEQGVIFTRHYADSTCTPSRVSILTGLYPERLGFRPTGLEIPPEVVTLPEALRSQGYQTHLVGKWHAGEARSESLPLAQGFDSFFGFHNQWELAGELTSSTQGVQRPTYFDPWLRGGLQLPEQHSGHLSDILADRSLQIIESYREREESWFLYHGFFAPHAPIQPGENFRSSHPSTPEGKYLALVDQLDHIVGRLVAKLEETGQADNTLIVFISDNGGTNRERNNNFPWRGKKDETYEGSFRTPLLMKLPSSLPAGKTISQTVMNLDLYPTLLAIAGIEARSGLDGRNLFPTMINDRSLPERARAWEKFIWNVDAMTFSYLSVEGRWRLSNVFGFPPELFDLQSDPAGETDVAGTHASTRNALQDQFAQESWMKSRIPVTSGPGQQSASTLYSGFDMTRSPIQNSFAIGIELPAHELDGLPHQYAQQDGVWRLEGKVAGQLELQLGNYRLHAPPLDPDRCNSVIVTGHFQPSAMYVRSNSEHGVKLYVNGHLKDLLEGVVYEPPAEADTAKPTVVFGEGSAVFSNLFLGTAADPYNPRVPIKYRELFQLQRESGQMQRASIQPMLDLMCRAGG